ncbi:MAG: C40 family peptidase [Bacteroidia bacterium]|nr:C40 family peptidase [Bacteroidia bacterium]
MFKPFLFTAVFLPFVSLGQTVTDYSGLYSEINSIIEQDTTYIASYFSSYGIDLTKIKTPELYQESFKWLTTPHKMGGASKFGIDCSGFAKQLYEKAYGVKLQGGSRDIYPKTNRVTPSELEEGDLVFFKVKSSVITHVGVFLQNRMFIHTSSSQGVMVSSLDDPYWSKYFFSAGRWPLIH